MGKNRKEVFAYKYLHDISEIPRNILIMLKKKWNRRNFDVGEYRKDRVCKKYKINEIEFKQEVKNYENEKVRTDNKG